VYFTFNLSYTSSWTCSISLDLYKLPCLWDDKVIYILSCTLHCKFARVTMFALSPHPYGSMFEGTTFINSLIQILNHLITLPINVFWSSIIIVNDVLYLVSHSSILGILDMVYYIIFGMWNYAASFNSWSSSYTTFSFSFFWITIWFICLAKFESPCDSFLSPLYHFSLEEKNRRIFKSL